MTAPTAPQTKKPPSRVHVQWTGEHRFDSGNPTLPTAVIDGDSKVAQSPPDALLTALGTCVSVDVLDILAKRRTPVESLEIDVVGVRVDTIPRRFKHITLNFKIAGRGIDKEQALRAVELSATKYCSVRDSLRSEIEVDWTVEISPPSRAS